ncbi:MAG: hybrid sensor histidine kinase/response regulator [Candidatus Magnetomorum sp.]|nr:hybrid sensor histidine kinase/response regulator [Candidatus Magnetomorum sp.]
MTTSKILIVDDTAANIQVLRGLLEKEYTLLAAKNGPKAIKLTEDKQPDLILLDIKMPEMDGYEVCQILKANEQTRDIPIIFVTAMDETEDEQKGFDMGAVDYITKPIKPPILIARVRTHLELKDKRDALVKMLKLEKELAKTKEDIYRITQHDLKSPLNAIINYPKLIKTDNLTEKQINQLKRISSAGYNMLNMINLSFDLFKMEQGSYQFNPALVDILPILDDISQDLQNFIKTKGAVLNISINGAPISDHSSFEIPGEKLLFYSMLANLIKNALEASPRKGKISIQLVDKDALTIVIHNQGAVPKNLRETFFVKYATSDKKSGTGLGTYSAKLIVETQGGNISMHSSDEKGTSITITFPKSL